MQKRHSRTARTISARVLQGRSSGFTLPPASLSRRLHSPAGFTLPPASLSRRLHSPAGFISTSRSRDGAKLSSRIFAVPRGKEYPSGLKYVRSFGRE